MSTATRAMPRRAYPRRRQPCDRVKLQEAERGLLIRYHADGDLLAREELVKRFLPLARELALRYRYTNEPFEDLLQVASLGRIGYSQMHVSRLLRRALGRLETAAEAA